MTDTDATILIVDDEFNNITLLKGDLEDAGYTQFLIARDGKEAWDVLQEKHNEIDVVLLDRMMPNMDGMQVMKLVKEDKNIRHIPVIMQTAAAAKEQVLEGIKSGVYYYLTKPYDEDTMLTIVSSALKEHRSHKKMLEDVKKFKPKLNLIKDSNFIIKNIADVEYLVTFLAGYFPDPDRVIVGLSEIFMNAIEHGNWGITYEEKKALMSNGTWKEEIQRRQQLPENQNKVAQIYYLNDSDNKKIVLHVKDQGNGFNWEKYLEIDPDRVTDPNGRGIAMARNTSFDSIEYKGNGNEVHCVVNL